MTISYSTVPHVPREELRFCVKKSGVAEEYVRLVQGMYDGSRTMVKCGAVGVTGGFKVDVGLDQGWAMSLFLFAMVMDRMTDHLSGRNPHGP